LSSGGFARRQETADVSTTASCCLVLADAARLVSSTLAERIPDALTRAQGWLLDRQVAGGSWPGDDGKPSVDVAVAGLEALVATGARPASRGLRRAGLWLRRRQEPSGFWREDEFEEFDEGGASHHARTARVVRALIAARSAEVDPIERGVNALLEPTAWNRGADPSVRELCDIAEGLAAFLEWSRDLPGATRPEVRPFSSVPHPSRSLHA